MISRPLNFISLLAFLKAASDEALLYKGDKQRKYGLTEHEWRHWMEFCKRRGLIEVKPLGKKRGRKPVLTDRGKRVLKRLEQFNLEYAELLGDIYGRPDSQLHSGS